jgi:hypothetical protein
MGLQRNGSESTLSALYLKIVNRLAVHDVGKYSPFCGDIKDEYWQRISERKVSLFVSTKP